MLMGVKMILLECQHSCHDQWDIATMILSSFLFAALNNRLNLTNKEVITIVSIAVESGVESTAHFLVCLTSLQILKPAAVTLPHSTQSLCFNTSCTDCKEHPTCSSRLTEQEWLCMLIWYFLIFLTILSPSCWNNSSEAFLA